VVGFAIFLGVVILAGRIIGEQFGPNGATVGAAVLGLADVDSVTVAMTRLVPHPLGEFDAGTAILVAVVSNMIAKLGLSVAFGRGRFAAGVAAMSLACWLAAGLMYWLANLWIAA
jgi:uncharacterized membrane protein (DUF4010 family)